MKKSLLAAAALSLLIGNAHAQRMTLHEEFTGENCWPCQETNPGFWQLCDTGSNPEKLIHISYMVPIPTPGFYCDRTASIHEPRSAYYNVPFAPYGRYDGAVPDLGCDDGADPGKPSCFTQADIDAEAARPDSFTVTATCSWNSSYDAVVTTVNITCTNAWTGSGATPDVRLRAALVQTNDFATPPGSNGETHFENVVQAMYPDAGGTVIPATWAAGETHSYTITGPVPAWVDKSKSPYMVVWIQDDNNLSVAQAAKTAPLMLTLDASLASAPAGYCVSGASGPVSPVVSLANTASTPLTSATIYYAIDGGTIASQSWTGTLPAGASVNVPLTATVMTTGPHTVYDSVDAPNGTADVNKVNNASSAIILVSSSAAHALPLATGFESALPADWMFFDANGNGQNWVVAAAINHAGGTQAAKFNGYSYYAGEEDYIILPVPASGSGLKLQFWVAYAQFNSLSSERLEVVYSTDCGTTWSSIYNKAGAELSTAESTFDPFTPTSAQWREEDVDLSTVPAGALLAFRGTSHLGNNIYVDDINLRSTLGVASTHTIASNVSLYPNPAKDGARVAFTLDQPSAIQISLLDITGRVITTVSNGQMSSGTHTVDVNTAPVEPGVYNVVIQLENEKITRQLVVTK